jgi:hypothetical protein
MISVDWHKTRTLAVGLHRPFFCSSQRDVGIPSAHRKDLELTVLRASQSKAFHIDAFLVVFGQQAASEAEDTTDDKYPNRSNLILPSGLGYNYLP